MKLGLPLRKTINQRSIHGETITTVDNQIDEGEAKILVLFLMWSEVSNITDRSARAPVDSRLYDLIGWDPWGV